MRKGLVALVAILIAALAGQQSTAQHGAGSETSNTDIVKIVGNPQALGISYTSIDKEHWPVVADPAIVTDWAHGVYVFDGRDTDSSFSTTMASASTDGWPRLGVTLVGDNDEVVAAALPIKKIDADDDDLWITGRFSFFDVSAGHFIFGVGDGWPTSQVFDNQAGVPDSTRHGLYFHIPAGQATIDTCYVFYTHHTAVYGPADTDTVALTTPIQDDTAQSFSDSTGFAVSMHWRRSSGDEYVDWSVNGQTGTLGPLSRPTLPDDALAGAALHFGYQMEGAGAGLFQFRYFTATVAPN
jgi:hypothetical protein